MQEEQQKKRPFMPLDVDVWSVLCRVDRWLKRCEQTGRTLTRVLVHPSDRKYLTRISNTVRGLPVETFV
jgi:hypothetical protein